jgi:hypothetical protein
VGCHACRTINGIELRTLDRHRDAAVTSLIPALSSRKCRKYTNFVASVVVIVIIRINGQIRSDAVIGFVRMSCAIDDAVSGADCSILHARRMGDRKHCEGCQSRDQDIGAHYRPSI